MSHTAPDDPRGSLGSHVNDTKYCGLTGFNYFWVGYKSALFSVFVYYCLWRMTHSIINCYMAPSSIRYLSLPKSNQGFLFGFLIDKLDILSVVHTIEVQCYWAFTFFRGKSSYKMKLEMWALLLLIIKLIIIILVLFR